MKNNVNLHSSELPVKLFQSHDRLTVAAPMPGVEPEDIAVEITDDDRLILRSEQRAGFKGGNSVLLDEWQVGGFSRELRLPCPVDGRSANVTYGNGVLVVALPIARHTQPAHVSPDAIAQARGERAGNQGNPVKSISNEQHQATAHPAAAGKRSAQAGVSGQGSGHHHRR